MTDADKLRAAELAILNAPFEERGWEEAVTAIAHATRSSAAHLLGIGGPVQFPLNVVAGNFAGYESYFSNSHFHGQCNWRVGTTTTPMSIQYEPDYAAYRRSNPTADYDDAASDLDIPFGCQSAMFLDRNGMVGVALLRSRRDGPCRPETLRAFALLRYQLARAIRMQMALDGEAAELLLGQSATGQCRTMLLDRHGSLAALSPAAEALFDADGPARLSGLQLRLSNAEEDRQLHRAMSTLLAGDELRGPRGHEMRAGRWPGHPRGRWRLSLLRLPRREHGLGFEPALSVSFHPLAN